jgi:hypothetical protein
LGSLTTVAEGDDNSRMTNPDGSSKYGYLTEMDFEATEGVTYYVRAACYESSSDSAYVLRVVKRVYTYSDWVVRPDTTVPVNMLDVGGAGHPVNYRGEGWHEEYETWVELYGVQVGSIPTPAAIQAHIDPAVATAAGFNYVDNIHYESDPGSGVLGQQTSSVQVGSWTTPRPDIPSDPLGLPWFDWHYEVWGIVQARSYRPSHAAVIGVAEGPPPPPNPEAILVEFESTDEPVIDSTLVIDRWEGRWQVSAGGFTYTYPAVPGSVEFLILTGDYLHEGGVGSMDWATWDLDESEVIATFDFTGGVESQTQTGIVVPNGLKPDGTFVVAWRVLSVGTLMQADKMGYEHNICCGTPDYPYLHDSLFPPIEPMTISFTVRNIPSWRYVYPLPVMTGEYFIAKPDLTWEPMALSVALAAPSTWSAEPVLHMLG